MTEFKDLKMRYIGKELDLFSQAVFWKSYLSQIIAPFLGTDVLEVGAGIGTNTVLLCSEHQKHWLCLEPDDTLLNALSDRIKNSSNFSRIETRLGTLENIQNYENYDTILYIDVLEHIKEDRLELEHASEFLRYKGVLIVLAPAHQWLYSPFDKSIGHFRRYSKKTLSSIGPPDLKIEQLCYLDSAGLIASMGNSILLRKNLPSINQIKFWDNWLVPLSIKLDLWLQYRIGKTIIGVWNKQ